MPLFTDFKDVWILILGWLLGLLAPAIVSAIKDRRESKVVKTALLTELQELQYKLLMLVFRVESKYGVLSHEFFDWAQTLLKGYSGINSTEGLLKAMTPLLKLTPEELSTLHQYKKQTDASSVLSFRKISLSLLDSSISFVVKFDKIFQSQLLDIKTHLGYMNEMTEEARYYFNLSFQKDISPENYKIAHTNLIAEHKNIASQARYVIKVIGQVLDKEN